MPVTLAQIAARQASATFSWEGESVTVAYHPGLVTDAMITQFDAGRDARNTALSQVLISWDVLTDDGTPFPFDVASLEKLDIEFKAAVLFAILDDMRTRPNPTATKTTLN